MAKIGFLHTAAVHQQTFDALVRDIDSAVALEHLADPALLKVAQREGITERVLGDINHSLQQLVDAGCDVVCCTCSTLGPVVEDRVIDGIKIHRIDRAVADQLMAYKRVLVIAAIESAAVAADELLEASARAVDANTRWLVALVPDAWIAFEAGDTALYCSIVADFVNKLAADYDAVFLSQASMMIAAADCQHAHVFTSPRPGVEALLASLA